MINNLDKTLLNNINDYENPRKLQKLIEVVATDNDYSDNAKKKLLGQLYDLSILLAINTKQILMDAKIKDVEKFSTKKEIEIISNYISKIQGNYERSLSPKNLKDLPLLILSNDILFQEHKPSLPLMAYDLKAMIQSITGHRETIDEIKRSYHFIKSIPKLNDTYLDLFIENMSTNDATYPHSDLWWITDKLEQDDKRYSDITKSLSIHLYSNNMKAKSIYGNTNSKKIKDLCLSTISDSITNHLSSIKTEMDGNIEVTDKYKNALDFVCNEIYWLQKTVDPIDDIWSNLNNSFKNLLNNITSENQVNLKFAKFIYENGTDSNEMLKAISYQFIEENINDLPREKQEKWNNWGNKNDENCNLESSNIKTEEIISIALHRLNNQFNNDTHKNVYINHLFDQLNDAPNHKKPTMLRIIMSNTTSQDQRWNSISNNDIKYILNKVPEGRSINLLNTHNIEKHPRIKNICLDILINTLDNTISSTQEDHLHAITNNLPHCDKRWKDVEKYSTNLISNSQDHQIQDAIDLGLYSHISYPASLAQNITTELKSRIDLLSDVNLTSAWNNMNKANQINIFSTPDKIDFKRSNVAAIANMARTFNI